MHTRTRKVLARIMSPGAMKTLEDAFKAKAMALVDGLVDKGSFDAIRDLAEVFPLSVFPDALGIDTEGREHLLTYGAMVFAGIGPENDSSRNLMAHAPVVLPWMIAKCQREALAPGSFGAQVYEAADTGEVTADEAPLLVRSFLSAGLDTTISSLGMALFNLARHPDQWAILAAKPSLARAAFDETLRYNSAAPYVFRTTPHETEIAGVGSAGTRRCCCCWLPPTATRPDGNVPTSSTSPAALPAISDLAPVSMAASARWWRGSKVRLCCRRWPTVWRGSRSSARRSIATAAACVR